MKTTNFTLSKVITSVCYMNVGLLLICKETSSNYFYGAYTVNPLYVTNVDYLWQTNGQNHRTSRFDLMETYNNLVVRRGQEFIIDFWLSRPYNFDTNQISLDFSRQTETQTTLPKEKNTGSWKFKTTIQSGTILRITATPSANTPIGKWVIKLYVMHKYNKMQYFYSSKQIYLLFNPWCIDDAVYIPREEERHEYVLKDYGYVFQANSVGPKLAYPWKFGQYERDILNCALNILTESGGLSYENLNDPVLVSRFLTSALNVNFKKGVLEGSWSGKYEDGTNPSKWTGSTGILQQYYRTRRPVKYGQCWVFAGIYASCCRALGIPCRVVTGFNVIADGNDDLHLNTLVDESDKVLGGEIVWNYHVWNEVWMKRNDFYGYDGWQAVDATPLFLSENYYRSGPASVTAVKRAELKKFYDTKHVFSLVNARQIKSLYNNVTRRSVIKKLIYDRIPGEVYTYFQSWEKVNLTSNYVYEGHWRFADDLISSVYSDDSTEIEDTELEIKNMFFNLGFTDSTIGSPLSIQVLIQNEDTVGRNISVNLVVKVVGAAGRLESLMSKFSEVVKIGAKSNETIQVNYTWDDYGTRILELRANFRIKLTAKEESSESVHFEQHHHSLITPAVEIKLENKPVVGEILKGSAIFKNPLPVAIHNCSFVIEGPGLNRQIEIILPRKVPVGTKATYFFSMTPTREGSAFIIAKFVSKELIADGNKAIEIKSRS